MGWLLTLRFLVPELEQQLLVFPGQACLCIYTL